MKKLVVLILVFGMLLGVILFAVLSGHGKKRRMIGFEATISAPGDAVTQLILERPRYVPRDSVLHEERGSWNGSFEVRGPTKEEQYALRVEVRDADPGTHRIDPGSQVLTGGRSFRFEITRVEVLREYVITVLLGGNPVTGATIATDPPALLAGPVTTDALGMAALQVRGNAGQVFSILAQSGRANGATAQLRLAPGQEVPLRIELVAAPPPPPEPPEQRVERVYAVEVVLDGVAQAGVRVTTDPAALAQPVTTNSEGIAELQVRGAPNRSFRIRARGEQAEGRSSPLTLVAGSRESVKITLAPLPPPPPPPSAVSRSYAVQVTRGSQTLSGVKIAASHGDAHGTTDAQGQAVLNVAVQAGTQIHFVATLGQETHPSDKVRHEEGPSPVTVTIRFPPETRTVHYVFEATLDKQPLAGVTVRVENETGMLLKGDQTGTDGKVAYDILAEVGEVLSYQVEPPHLPSECQSPRTTDRLVHGKHAGTVRLDWSCGEIPCEELEAELQLVHAEAWGIAFTLMSYIPGSLGNREQVKVTDEMKRRREKLSNDMNRLIQLGTSDERCQELMIDITLAQMLAAASVGDVTTCDHYYTSKFEQSHQGYRVMRNAVASLYRALARTVEGSTRYFDEANSLLEDVDRQYGQASAAVQRMTGGRRHCLRGVLAWQRANASPIPSDPFELIERAKTSILTWEKWCHNDPSCVDVDWISTFKERVNQ